ncbi:MAG TPA: serine hydrolase domain-containing protein [Lacipirellula sp.]
MLARNLVVIAFLAQVLASAARSEELKREVEQALPKSIGACVLAIDGGEVVFKEGFGLADVESRDPCTPATNFRMASVSKQFTALAVMLLVDRGQLALDDTLDEFFSGGPKYWDKITVEQLLTHTSGLPDYENLIPEGTTLQLDDMDVVRMLLDADEPLFQPGAQWQYSNSAFVVLGMIVEIAAERPFHEFMADEIFRPLEMNDTLLYQRGLNEVAHRAFGHEWKDERWVRADQSVTSATRGDGVVYTSLEDYEKWLRSLVFPVRGVSDADNADHHAAASASETPRTIVEVLTPESHRAIFSPQEKTTRGDSHYGYGWFIDEYRGERRIHHNGDSRGFRICSQTFPDRRAAVLLQFNSEVDEDMTKVGQRLADILIFDREE